MDELILFHESEKIYRDLQGAAAQNAPFEGAARLLSFAAKHGLSGNLWQRYFAYCLGMDENPYSLAAERKGKVTGTLRDLALKEAGLLRELYFYFPCEDYLSDFTGPGEEKLCGEKIRLLSDALSKTGNAEEFLLVLDRFYETWGCGSFAFHRAFGIKEQEEGVRLAPIEGMDAISLSDLVGYEKAKKKLTDNTESFLSGQRANNCMLYGDAGTGKSSSIKAIANQYFPKGLRLIELYKHEIRLLPRVIEKVRDRNYRFIVYMDDLSFEEFETDYKYLKAAIEGGLRGKPENLLIYATSNRRHLIRESFSDRDGSDLHRNETVQEKQSLSARFGVSIYFGSPEKKEYHEIVRRLSERAGINLPEKELFAQADQWEIMHGGRSGRTAQQFINHLL